MPTTDRLRRLLPLSGVLFTAVLATGLVLTASEPDNSASKADIYAYWHSHHGVQLISSLILIPFGMLFLLAFAAELRRALRSGEAGEALYSPIALAGGIAAAVGLGVTGSLGAAVATAANHREVDATYTLAQLQSYDWVPWMAGFGVLLLASGIGGLRTRALPRPMAAARRRVPDTRRVLRALRAPGLDFRHEPRPLPSPEPVPAARPPNSTPSRLAKTEMIQLSASPRPAHAIGPTLKVTAT